MSRILALVFILAFVAASSDAAISGSHSFLKLKRSQQVPVQPAAAAPAAAPVTAAAAPAAGAAAPAAGAVASTSASGDSDIIKAAKSYQSQRVAEANQLAEAMIKEAQDRAARKDLADSEAKKHADAAKAAAAAAEAAKKRVEELLDSVRNQNSSPSPAPQQPAQQQPAQQQPAAPAAAAAPAQPTPSAPAAAPVAPPLAAPQNQVTSVAVSNPGGYSNEQLIERIIPANDGKLSIIPEDLQAAKDIIKAAKTQRKSSRKVIKSNCVDDKGCGPGVDPALYNDGYYLQTGESVSKDSKSKETKEVAPPVPTPSPPKL